MSCNARMKGASGGFKKKNKTGLLIFSTSPPIGGKLKSVTLHEVNEWSGQR